MTVQEVLALLVALGTISLAIAAFWALKNTARQQKLLSVQLDIQQSERRPNLQVKDFRFDGDSIVVRIQNVSVAPAYWVGVATRFYLVYATFYERPQSGQELSPSRVSQLEAEGKQTFVKYHLFPPGKWPRLTLDGEVVQPDEAVSFTTSDLLGAIVPAYQEKQITVAPKFYVAKNESSGKAFRFDEFRDFLLQHDISIVAVSLGLVFKDITESIMKSEWIAKSAINISSHKSLGEAWEHGYAIYFLPLSATEIQTKQGWLPRRLYTSMRTPYSTTEDL